MTKKDFLNALANGLKDLPPNRVSDILFDYQDYFNSQKDKMSEEEMILSLGSIDKIINNYQNENTHNNTIEFTQEIPIINSDTSYDNKKFIQTEKDSYTKNEENFYEDITEENDETSHFSKSKEKFFKNRKKENISQKKKKETHSTSQNESTTDIKPKNFFNKKSFLGYLFSLPLLVIALPVGFALGLATFSAYIAFILLVISIGATIFLCSLVPLGIGFAGFITILVKSFGTMFFTNIPSFILDFPSFFIILLSISFIFLSVGIFSLGLAYCRSSKKSIISISRSLFRIAFKRGDSINEV